MMKRHVAEILPDTPFPAWWEPLFQASRDSAMFLSRPWMQTWLEVYGADFRCHWVRWEVDGRDVGGCLLVARTSWKRLVPLRSLYLNATGELAERTPLAEYNAILCDPAHEDAIHRDFEKLLEELAWDRLFVSGYVAGGPLDALVRRMRSSLVQGEARPSPYVDFSCLPSGAFEATLTSNTRSQVRRSRKLYEERGAALQLHAASSLDEAAAALERLAELHNARWLAKGMAGSFANTRVADFHRRLVPRLWAVDAVDLLSMRAGDSDIGYLYNFKRHGKLHFFQSGFAYETDARLKPGLLTHCLAIEHYRNQGFAEYDFLAGDAQYKRSLAKQERVLHWTVLYRDRAWMRLLVWASSRQRSLQRAAHEPS
jgi:hypothetical protein